jgi:fatty-acyl-CoA synthase
VLAAASAEAPPVTPSPDDLYILYTGGTTGMPKGVLWRQADIFVEALGGRRNDGAPFEDYETLVAGASGTEGGLRAVLAPPFMHGAGHWMSFLTFHRGGTVFIQSHPERLDPVDIWSLIEREKVAFLLIVGDAFARPLLDELDRNTYDLSSLTVLLSGGAPLSAPLKQEFLSHLPALIVVDGLGSSEAGGQMQHVSAGGAASTGTFMLSPGNHVLSADLTRELGEDDDEIGWLASRDGSRSATSAALSSTTTYPTVNGVRYAVPGDRARVRPGMIVELHGRDSVTINSGGEKIFAEEVEHALRHHPAVYDVVVAPRPSDRWGQEVVAIVRLRDGFEASDGLEAELLDESEKHIARYKLPKAFVFVDEVVCSPSGKADYRWARTTASLIRPRARDWALAAPIHPQSPNPDRVRRRADCRRGSPGARLARGRDPRRGPRDARVRRAAAAPRADHGRAMPGVRPAHVPGLPAVQALRSGAGRARTPQGLPEGEEKTRAVRDVRRDRARYDLVNRIMTFRMDVGWRKRTVTDLPCRPPPSCSTSPGIEASPKCAGAASSRSASTCPKACCGRIGAASPACSPTCSASLSATAMWTARPVGSPFETCASSRRSSLSSREWCGSEAGWRSSRSPRPTTRSCAGATASTSGRSCRSSAACCLTAARIATFRSWPTSRA